MPRFRAQFEGMILPNDDTVIRVKEPVGPFLVEVFEIHDGAQGKSYVDRYSARMLPTKVRFGGRTFKDLKEAMDTTASNFRKMTQDWYEV